MDTTYRFALRVDLDNVDIGDLNDWVRDNCDSYIGVREGMPDNPHTHWLLTSKKKLAALRKSIQRFLSGERGNAAYSLKECAEEYGDYEKYMMKGDNEATAPEVVLRCGLDYTDDWIKEKHKAYYVTKEEITKQRQKRKHLAAATAVEKLEERVKAKGFRWDQKRDIAREYIRMCKEGRKAINTFSARSIVNAVCVALCPGEEAIEELTNMIVPDFYA